MLPRERFSTCFYCGILGLLFIYIPVREIFEIEGDRLSLLLGLISFSVGFGVMAALYWCFDGPRDYQQLDRKNDRRNLTDIFD